MIDAYQPAATPRPLRQRLLPWAAGYHRADIRYDVLAGSTLAAYAIPSSIAYAQLAGMSVQTGLYCYLFAGLVYWLFGMSRQLAVGPTSSVALTLAATLSTFAAADPARYAALATATAFFVGLIALGAWAMRWGTIVHFISETVLTGFKIGAGIVIAVSQLPLLLGLAGGQHGLWGTLTHIAKNIGATHLPTLTLGLTALVLLQLGQMRFRRWPIPLIVVVLALVVMSIPGIEAWTIATVGTIPRGIPLPALPHLDLTELDTLLPLSLACFLLAYNEGIAAARLLALRHGYAVDPNRELLGLAGSNIAISIGHGFPSGGGLSQALVNDQAGARSPLSLVVCSAWMVVALLFLTDIFERLPQPLLAALVLASVQSMFKLDELRQMRRVSIPEFVIALVTIAAVLVLGILKGVLVACIFSLALLIRRLAQPECVVLGRIPGTNHFASLIRHPTAQTVPGVLVFRANAALLYFNVETVREHLDILVDGMAGPLRRIVIDLAFTTEFDLSTLRMFADFARRMQDNGVELCLADAHYQVRALLTAHRLEPLFGDLSRAHSIIEQVEAPLAASATPAGDAGTG